MKLRLLLLLLLLPTATACNSTSEAIEEPAPTQIAASPSAKNTIKTQPLSPEPIRIGVASLPKPFASDSASKSPNVIPIPQNPTLKVPQGFTVNVFAENLDRPRWLALTPSGEVLVTETRENRIRLLNDTNGDGVADTLSLIHI